MQPPTAKEGPLKPLSIEGSLLVIPDVYHDTRGSFVELFREDLLEKALGFCPRTAQTNCSVSRRGVIRGVHFADVPPGQAKYVSCVSGAIIDVIVDIRVGSATFGQWEGVRLDDENRRSLYIAPGLGHAFMAVSESATVVYLCSEPYAPGREHGIDPLDPDLGIEWPAGIPPILSDKDAAAPSLAEAARDGLLPTLDACQAFLREL
jgi:dTDP-4-dehydrorhamnose 3,5-epimerase